MKKYILTLIFCLTAMFLIGCNTQPDVAVETDSVQDLTEDVTEEPAPIKVIERMNDEIKIYGPDGFSEEELTINLGDSVTWINENTKEKSVVLTFQKDGSRTFFNSDVIGYGEEFNYEFEETGSYQYWVMGFPQKAMIVVE